jgi:hypothetical protein
MSKEGRMKCEEVRWILNDVGRDDDDDDDDDNKYVVILNGACSSVPLANMLVRLLNELCFNEHMLLGLL